MSDSTNDTKCEMAFWQIHQWISYLFIIKQS